MDNTKDIQFELESAFAEVFLTTRITQVENKMLDEIRTWLQTENQTATIRKQEAVRRTIRMAYEYMQNLITQMDNKIVAFPPQQKEATPQIEHNSKTQEKKTNGGYIVAQVRAGKKVGNEYDTSHFNKTPQNVDSEKIIPEKDFVKKLFAE